MTFGQTARWAIAVIAVTVCAASWISLGLAWALEWPQPVFVASVFAAAVSTEAAIWVAGVILGWTAFANRAELWKKLNGGSAA